MNKARTSQVKTFEQTFVNAVVGLLKLSVLSTTTFFMVICICVFLELFMTEPVHRTAKVLIENELGVKEYTLEKVFHEYSFGEKRGEWWIELEHGFDIRKLKQNKQFTNRYIQADRPDTSEEIIKILLLTWGYQNADDFESYYAENTVIGNDTLCNVSTIRNCQIRIYAKDGDKNLFINMSIW